MNNELYLESKKTDNPEIRQNFFDSIELGELSKYVDKLIYHPTQSPHNPNQIAGFRINFSPNKKVDIDFFPEIFKCFSQLEDVLGTIFYHEGYHARESFEGNNDLLYAKLANTLGYQDIVNFEGSILELRAYENQIKNFEKMNFSVYYRAKACFLFGAYGEKCKELEKIINPSELNRILFLASKIKKQLENEKIVKLPEKF